MQLMRTMTVKNRALVIGIFDLFHVGHLRYLQYARSVAQQLVVALGSDQVCLRSKGKLPIIPQSQRMELLQGFGWIDEVNFIPCSLSETEQSVAWMLKWRIDHVVVGGDWEHSERWQKLEPLLNSKGISVEYSPYTTEISTTGIVNKIRSTH
ncbi:glycerol-3-phosphate cytidylyltransferase [Oceanospirillum multiglobuliferum]|nr:glycerol-3-phosphate cytidylyltransferase [Oceanospirillum multiglobuliferum]